MKPDKILWLLGYSNLSLILEQERSHWLMKTDKNKQVQDSRTGDIYQGKIDNIGTDVIIESRKLPYKFDFITDIKFALSHADDIIDIKKSAFPHSEEVNGLMMGIVKSINYPISDSPEVHRTYKFHIDNAEEVVIPFGVSCGTEGVFATHWLKTTTTPKLIIANDVGAYTIERDLEFVTDITHPVWYYPIDENLQPFNLTNLGSGSYETQAIDNNNYIGYPLFWFTCDNSAVGTNVTFTNNTNSVLHVSNNGNGSPMSGLVFTGFTTPDGSPTSQFVINVTPENGTFSNSPSDFYVHLDTTIKFINTTTSNEYDIVMNFAPSGDNYITMTNNVGWEYVDENTYQISMDVFDGNAVEQSILTPMLNVSFSSATPFVKNTFDECMSGMKASASMTDENRYPYDLNKIDGLPSWMQNLDDDIAPEHLIAYAYHVPSSYSPGDPNTLQGAGLIVDPGLKPVPNAVPTTDNIGRVYVLSNDDIEYHNNTNAEYPKPARTAARICDIPTTVFDLNDSSSTTGDPIVDKKYVRTEASLTLEDKERLYNDLQSRWVRPTALDISGTPVCELDPEFPGKFAFASEELLNRVYMYHESNNFRVKTNLNPMVNVLEVTIDSIVNGGTGYAIDDTGVCIIGGFEFKYKVTGMIHGSVSECMLIRTEPPETEYINIANFDMLDYQTGITAPYGTSPTSGTGTGLSIRLRIDPSYLSTIIPSLGEFFTNLFALVRTDDGLYAYKFDIDNASISVPKPGIWVKDIKLADFEGNSTDIHTGGLSMRNSYMRSILPTVRELPVVKSINNTSLGSVKTVQTATMLNIIDTELTPVLPNNPASVTDAEIGNVVDICKYHGMMFGRVSLDVRDPNAVKEYLISHDFVRYDCYILWRWVSDYAFEFAVVHRGLNNYFSSDTETLLPGNDLKFKTYVHTNGNTTIVWNHPLLGPMTWVYDPTYTKKETYYIDAETMDLHVIREDMTFDKIDIYGLREPIIVNNAIQFNVLTTNPISAKYDYSESPIYQQPDLTEVISIGTQIPNDDPTKKYLFGNWRLVFPRVNTVTFDNDATNTHWVPMNLQVIKGRSVAIGDDVLVKDDNGNDVTSKSIVITQTQDQTGAYSLNMMAFNSETKKWEKI